MFTPLFALCVTGMLGLAPVHHPAPAPVVMPPASPALPRVIVCVGDSITDGQTWSLVLQQSLREAKLPVPVCIAAGIGGDTTDGILKRLDRDVIHFHPDMVMINIGINEIGRVKTSQYQANLDTIVQRLHAKHISVMLLTLTRINGWPDFVGYVMRDTEMDAPLSWPGANVILHRVAEKQHCRIAEVSKAMWTAPKGMHLWMDSAHLNFDGYRYMTLGILDGLGYPNVAVPNTFADFKVEMLPGVVHNWRIRAAAKGEPALNEQRVAALSIDDAWKPYTVPEVEPFSAPEEWWLEQERRHGFAMKVGKTFGPASEYYGYTEIVCKKERHVFINTGGEGVRMVFLNGKRIFNSEYSAGWHAGGHRIPVTLNAGTNKLVIATGPNFFLSVTDTDIW